MVKNKSGIRGVQKKMIVLKTTGSRYFDEAHFFLRREAEPRENLSGDMLLEANRILRGCLFDAEEEPKKGGIRPLWVFLFGTVFGIGVGFLSFFLTRR